MSNQIQDLRDQAERFRRLARIVEDQRNREQLLAMAVELDEQADALERDATRFGPP
jgi:hypothetical protein